MNDKLFRAVTTLQVAWICGGGMAARTLPGAWAWRGYCGGFGGEWLLIILATAVGGWLGGSLADLVIGKTQARRKAHR